MIRAAASAREQHRHKDHVQILDHADEQSYEAFRTSNSFLSA